MFSCVPRPKVRAAKWHTPRCALHLPAQHRRDFECPLVQHRELRARTFLERTKLSVTQMQIIGLPLNKSWPRQSRCTKSIHHAVCCRSIPRSEFSEQHFGPQCESARQRRVCASAAPPRSACRAIRPRRWPAAAPPPSSWLRRRGGCVDSAPAARCLGDGEVI